MHIYAGTLKTPETGRKRTKTGITAGTIAEAMLLYCLPIIGSYTGGNAGNAGNVFRLFQPKSDRRNTGRHAGNGNGRPKTDTNGRPPKAYKS